MKIIDKRKFKNDLIKDFKVAGIHMGENPSFLKITKHVIYAMFFIPWLNCVFWYRVNNFLEHKKWPLRSFLNARRIYLFSNDISSRAEIGGGLHLVHLTDIVIGENVKIGEYATILNGVTIGSKVLQGNNKMPNIGDCVSIGTGSKIVGDVNIGNNVKIGALTYCDKSISDNTVAYGNPMFFKK